MGKLLRDLVTFVIGLVEILLVFRFILKLFAANPRAGFVAWIYDMTEPLLTPFLFAFPTPSVQGGYTLEFTTLFALFVYAFIGYLLQELLAIIDHRSTKR
jgi:YggT family protein